MRRVKLKVIGDVQGVSYRYWAKDVARKLDVKGWIRNDEDGNVTAEIEGEAGNVAAFVDWAREGSPMSTVENLEITEKEYLGDFRKFEVK